MKTLIQLTLLAIVAAALATVHPFQLAMPWQTGDPVPVNNAMNTIMSTHDLVFVDVDWGQITPFNYVSSSGTYETNGNPATVCTAVRGSMDAWGTVTTMDRRSDGCFIEAAGPGPMTATMQVVEDPDARRNVRIEIKVQHSS